MPELDELDFESARRALLDEIRVPELAEVRDRARAIRRRRHGMTAAAAALSCVAALGAGTLLISDSAGPGPGRGGVAASTDALPSGSIWRGEGLTLLGLNGPVLDQPGDLRDIQFGDTDHGYALSAACAGQSCTTALAATSDGGRTWTDWPLPQRQATTNDLPALVALDGKLLVVTSSRAWLGRYGQGDWQEVDLSAVPQVVSAPAGGRLWVGPRSDTCTAGPVRVWRPDGGLAQLANQPSMEVCWAAPTPAADGAWWVGGRLAGASGKTPAVGVTRDQGQTWQVIPLTGASTTGAAALWAQVSTLGSDVYASVVSVRGGNPHPETLAIHAVLRSANQAPFTPYANEVGTLIGDVVPLLDGRLVAAGPMWYVSAGKGASLKPAAGSLPYVGRIQRTAGGWIAYDLFDSGWAAISRDGETWQKVNVR